MHDVHSARPGQLGRGTDEANNRRRRLVCGQPENSRAVRPRDGGCSRHVSEKTEPVRSSPPDMVLDKGCFGHIARTSAINRLLRRSIESSKTQTSTCDRQDSPPKTSSLLRWTGRWFVFNFAHLQFHRRQTSGDRLRHREHDLPVVVVSAKQLGISSEK